MSIRLGRRTGVAAAVVLLCLSATLALAPPAAAATTATFTTTSTWDTGYTAQYTIANSGPSTVTGWRLEFDLPATAAVGTFWDALLARSGNHYVFTNRDYNATIAVGASVSFGFVASGTSPPSNCTVNGAACAGGGGGTTTTTTTQPTTTTSPPPPPPPGSIRFAPYIDITFSQPTLAGVANATGQRFFTLAFILGSSAGCSPAWGGTIPLNDARIIGEVRDLEALGGEVIVASGGALGPYLESVCGSATALEAAYEQVLDAVGSTHLDLDIEASIDADMVNQALATLQRRRPSVTVSYTLRVQSDDFGVDPFSVQVLQSAVRNGVRVSVVNPMVMDFGSSRPWGDALVAAAGSTLNQMRGIFTGVSDATLRRMLGATAMIGRNDTGPITTQAVAQQLVTWANQNHIGFLAFWSVGRDNGGCPGGGALPTCSGIAQSTWEFTRIFQGFTG